MSWFDLAACKGADPNIWFPDTDNDDIADNHGRQAKAICATCPVQLDCLVDALERNEDGGIWGGAGEDFRRHLRRHLAAATHDPTVLPDVCGCGWCAAVHASFDGERHIDDPNVPVVAVLSDGRELRAPTGPTYRNGAGASCGLRVTYARGCRCGACELAVQMYGQEQKFDQRRDSA